MLERRGIVCCFFLLFQELSKQIEGHTICALGDAAAWPVQVGVATLCNPITLWVVADTIATTCPKTECDVVTSAGDISCTEPWLLNLIAML